MCYLVVHFTIKEEKDVDIDFEFPKKEDLRSSCNVCSVIMFNWENIKGYVYVSMIFS